MSKNRPFVVNCDMMCKQNDREEADKMNLDIVGRIRKESFSFDIDEYDASRDLSIIDNH